ncbi:MAG: hypothetical protein QNJ53_14035 [Pleurocapsa sp. MO_192.B19]|nr:hypothetical protein [Pleurocapsa sp. MO_192.B19]
MKLNLPKLLLTAGLSLGIISFASVAEAGINLNGSSLTGHLPQPTTKRQPQYSKSLTCNGSSLSGQTTKKQSQQQSKRMSSNGSSLTGQKTEKQLPQQLKGLPRNGSSLTGQVSQKQQKR